MRDILTHLRLTTCNSYAFCGAKSGRYTRVDVTAKTVTCTTCLSKAVEFHAKASGAVLARQAELATKGG